MPNSFPLHVSRYLLSPAFNNLSLKDQQNITTKFQLSYRNYFSLDQVTNHLELVTRDRFTRKSLEQALRNASEKYSLIDWYRFVRDIKARQKKLYSFTPMKATAFIISDYRKYRCRKVVFGGM